MNKGKEENPENSMECTCLEISNKIVKYATEFFAEKSHSIKVSAEYHQNFSIEKQSYPTKNHHPVMIPKFVAVCFTLHLEAYYHYLI